MDRPADAHPAPPAAGDALLAPFHVPALDGLRAVAALLVFANHAIPGPFPVIGRFAAVGWSGVSVFFALSGFLVTYLLLREEAASAARGGPARFSILRFWARRCLRIWPLYLLAVGIAFLVIPRLPSPWNLGVPAGGEVHARLVDDHALPAATFLFNWSAIEHGWPLTPFAHLWSVAVEEQLYVCLPLFLLLCPARFRRAGLVAAAAGSIAWQGAALLRGDLTMSWYMGTFPCAHSFTAGALVAEFLAARRGVVPRAPTWIAFAVPAIYIVHGLLPTRIEPQPVLASARLVALDAMSVGALWCCLPGGPFARILAWRPLAALGRISYGFYVWHVVLLDWTRAALADAAVPGGRGAGYVVSGSVTFVLTVAVAWASHRFFERPFLRLKERFA